MTTTILELINNHWTTLISLLITIWSLLRNYNWKRTLSIYLSLIVDNSHSVTKLIAEHCEDTCIKHSSENLNHQITHLLSTFPALAKKWIYINKPEAEWQSWEQKLQISMDTYRLRNRLLTLLKLK